MIALTSCSCICFSAWKYGGIYLGYQYLKQEDCEFEVSLGYMGELEVNLNHIKNNLSHKSKLLLPSQKSHKQNAKLVIVADYPLMIYSSNSLGLTVSCGQWYTEPLYVQENVHKCTHACRGHRSALAIVLPELPTLVFETVPSRLGWPASKSLIILLPPLQQWGCRCTPACLAFYGKLRLTDSHLLSKHFLDSVTSQLLSIGL